MTEQGKAAFAPCPFCKQYSHSIGEGQAVAAFMHFQSMIAHPVRGHPMGDAFDEQTRDAAQVLMALAKLGASLDDEGMVEKVEVALWNANKLIGCSKGFHEGASDGLQTATDKEREEIGFLARAAIAAMKERGSEMSETNREVLDRIEAERTAMPPEDRAELERREYEAQRESWIRAMAPCEHGVADAGLSTEAKPKESKMDDPNDWMPLPEPPHVTLTPREEPQLTQEEIDELVERINANPNLQPLPPRDKP